MLLNISYAEVGRQFQSEYVVYLTLVVANIILKHKTFKKNNFFSYYYSQLRFQCTLLVEMITLVTRLKSTLLLKMKCQDTQIYMKTECLQTKCSTALFHG